MWKAPAVLPAGAPDGLPGLPPYPPKPDSRGRPVITTRFGRFLAMSFAGWRAAWRSIPRLPKSAGYGHGHDDAERAGKPSRRSAAMPGPAHRSVARSLIGNGKD
jgi:hypothetical protein